MARLPGDHRRHKQAKLATIEQPPAMLAAAMVSRLDEEEKVRGAVAVAAITDDFTSEVINKRRDDEQVPPKLTARNERKTAERARFGIEMLETKQNAFAPTDSRTAAGVPAQNTPILFGSL